jgi:mycofactocin precursor
MPSEPTITELSPVPPDAAGDAAPETAPAEAGALVVEELIVEDVSIDGMCGVY